MSWEEALGRAEATYTANVESGEDDSCPTMHRTSHVFGIFLLCSKGSSHAVALLLTVTLYLHSVGSDLQKPIEDTINLHNGKGG